jgi:hypothetical protein
MPSMDNSCYHVFGHDNTHSTREQWNDYWNSSGTAKRWTVTWESYLAASKLTTCELCKSIMGWAMQRMGKDYAMFEEMF